MKIYFELFYSEPKGQLTPNFIGSIDMTYRSNVAKIILTGNPRWPPFKNLYVVILLKSKGQLTRNLSGNQVSDTGPSWHIVCYSYCVNQT